MSMNLAQLAEQSAERLGERLSMDFEGDRLTNHELQDRARRFQRGFANEGLGRGDIAALFMVNHPLVYPAFGGVFRTGAAVVPVMFQLSASELRYVLQDTKARCVITDEFSIIKTREAIQGLDHIEWIAVLGGKDNPDATPREIPLETLLEAGPEETIADIRDDDLAVLLYTSGTTGTPKGVMLGHDNLLGMAEAAHDAQEQHLWEGPYISASAMPMAHIFGVGVMLSGYLLRAELKQAYGVQLKWFEPVSFMKTIQEHRATTMASVPTMMALILNHPQADQYDLSSLKEVVCGAAPLPPDLARAFMEKHGCRVREIYGMTENTGIATANRMSEPYRPGSCGRPYLNVEVQIRDDENGAVAAGALGEIVTRGPTTMKGYLNRPEATDEAIRDGWLHTGDVGYLDDDGFLFVVDRKKDMIIKGGENIYPAEIEKYIYELEEVAEAAVIGVPHAVYGEEVIAYVVLRSGAELTTDKIIEHVASRTSKFRAPAEIHFLPSLPKSGVGKILRRELRAQAAEACSGAEPSAAPGA